MNITEILVKYFLSKPDHIFNLTYSRWIKPDEAKKYIIDQEAKFCAKTQHEIDQFREIFGGFNPLYMSKLVRLYIQVNNEDNKAIDLDKCKIVKKINDCKFIGNDITMIKLLTTLTDEYDEYVNYISSEIIEHAYYTYLTISDHNDRYLDIDSKDIIDDPTDKYPYIDHDLMFCSYSPNLFSRFQKYVINKYAEQEFEDDAQKELEDESKSEPDTKQIDV